MVEGVTVPAAGTLKKLEGKVSISVLKSEYDWMLLTCMKSLPTATLVSINWSRVKP